MAASTKPARGEPAPLAITVIPLGPWTRQALCAGVDTGIFFSAHDDPATQARQICARCPVTADCLQYALDSNEQHGIWGGLNPAERVSLRRRKARERDRQQAASIRKSVA